MVLKPSIKTSGAYVPQSEASEELIASGSCEKTVLRAGADLDVDLTPTASTESPASLKPAACLDTRIYVPSAGCSDCEFLEERVARLEECCAEVEDTLDNKVDKVAGKGLSANDYTDPDKAKLDSIVWTKAGILAVLGYEEITITMTDINDNVVSRKVLAEVTP